jgi:hypothetical protein
MVGLEEVNNKKERILSLIRTRGPSLPVHVAKTIGVDGIFAGAFLSELFAEKKIKMSNLRVGSSPLYYLEGQENMLENYVQHLNSREREAYELLKKERVLEDEKMNPIVRVAIRAIKDFAVPVRIRSGGEVRQHWKYFNLSEKDVRDFIKGASVDEKIKEEIVKENKLDVKKEVIEVKTEKNVDKVSRERNSSVDEYKSIEKKVVKKNKENDFGLKIKEYLSNKDIEVLEIYSDKKREFNCRVRIDMMFGKQEYYLVAKDKKSVTENDLSVAMQAAHGKKMPALVFSSGDLNKKGREHLKEWGNLVGWERVKI